MPIFRPRLMPSNNKWVSGMTDSFSQHKNTTTLSSSFKHYSSNKVMYPARSLLLMPNCLKCRDKSSFTPILTHVPDNLSYLDWAPCLLYWSLQAPFTLVWQQNGIYRLERVTVDSLEYALKRAHRFLKGKVSLFRDVTVIEVLSCYFLFKWNKKSITRPLARFIRQSKTATRDARQLYTL